MIQYPDIRQKDGHDCGLAVLLAGLDVLGVKLPKAYRKLANRVQGMHPETLEAILRGCSVPVLAGNMTLDDVEHFTDHGKPVFCPMAFDSGHWVAVATVLQSHERENDPGYVQLHDPARGHYGGRRTVTAQYFEEHWNDRTRLGHEFDHWGIVAG